MKTEFLEPNPENLRFLEGLKIDNSDRPRWRNHQRIQRPRGVYHQEWISRRDYIGTNKNRNNRYYWDRKYGQHQCPKTGKDFKNYARVQNKYDDFILRHPSPDYTPTNRRSSRGASLPSHWLKQSATTQQRITEQQRSCQHFDTRSIEAT